MPLNLDDDLLKFLLLEIPIPKQRDDGFMDIVEVQYHENTITMIYAYFLNPKKNKAIADLFFSTLLEIVQAKSFDKKFQFDNYRCYTEYFTNKGNRIDLLIKSGDDICRAEDSAIIVENKIFSGIHNDLEDYWDSIKSIPENKVGILLTVSPTNTPKEYAHLEYLNITHEEWINGIKSRGLPHDLTSNEYVYLTDFIKNMETIKKGNTMSPDAKFFFEYTSKVLRAKDTYDAARSHVITQLQILSEKLQMKLLGNSVSWRHIWDEKSWVYYVFGIENILTNEPSIRVILEIYSEGLSKEVDLRTLLNEKGFYSTLADDHQSNKSWAHLAFKDYTLSLPELEHLAETLHQKIVVDFSDAYEMVRKYLHGSDISNTGAKP
ncbi:PD-(D/E)XK nuclease family protein [Chryseolinea sp. H1M3-3]|uniref:PD-(D/E)XK nuclease family protein n=1 Tax=Chryseolinea sp. H1M3-3 TaxID=3034144 RepID=UPI0023ED8670|nr:PD-(D/E)XK nuclease family protein [Chryseolinea sp. H1M3-3]